VASAGPVTSAFMANWQASRIGEGWRSQVSMPPSCSYVPLGTYPKDTTGGMLQKALLWPWVAGMAGMVASWKWWWTEGDGADPVDDCVLLFLITAVERFLSGVEGEKFRLAGESVLLARVPCTCVRVPECSLPKVKEFVWIGRPGKRRYEGMIIVFEPGLGFCS